MNLLQVAGMNAAGGMRWRVSGREGVGGGYTTSQPSNRSEQPLRYIVVEVPTREDRGYVLT